MGQFKCPNGPCIMSEWFCDRQRDCPDGEDEANCGTFAIFFHYVTKLCYAHMRNTFLFAYLWLKNVIITSTTKLIEGYVFTRVFLPVDNLQATVYKPNLIKPGRDAPPQLSGTG